jgi:hypothetical protein
MMQTKLQVAGWLDNQKAFVGLAPVFWGLVSVLFGQDSNWDLRNYHLYNPSAWLSGKLGTDLAPAQLQSYFNPLLDVMYYYMSLNWPPRLVGFVMGLLHGTAFVLLSGIILETLRETSKTPAYGASALIAFAGCLGPGFLSELGNTMGDNITSVLVLLSVFLLLRFRGRLISWNLNVAARVFLSGLVMGLATQWH